MRSGNSDQLTAIIQSMTYYKKKIGLENYQLSY